MGASCGGGIRFREKRLTDERGTDEVRLELEKLQAELERDRADLRLLRLDLDEIRSDLRRSQEVLDPLEAAPDAA